VILVEAEKDIGGHAITSGGNVPLGGGTSVQKKYGIMDSPDLLFRDLTDWSVVEAMAFRITVTTTARSFAAACTAIGRNTTKPWPRQGFLPAKMDLYQTKFAAIYIAA
jgi:hypothetical protein